MQINPNVHPPERSSINNSLYLKQGVIKSCEKGSVCDLDINWIRPAEEVAKTWLTSLRPAEDPSKA